MTNIESSDLARITTTLLTVEDVARIMQIHPGSVYRFVYQGKLPIIKIGPGTVRIHPATFEEWLLKRQQTHTKVPRKTKPRGNNILQ